MLNIPQNEKNIIKRSVDTVGIAWLMDGWMDVRITLKTEEQANNGTNMPN